MLAKLLIGSGSRSVGTKFGRNYAIDVTCLVGIVRRTPTLVGAVVEYRTCNREVVGSTHTRSTATNLVQVANLLCAQANLASYP